MTFDTVSARNYFLDTRIDLGVYSPASETKQESNPMKMTAGDGVVFEFDDANNIYIDIPGLFSVNISDGKIDGSTVTREVLTNLQDGEIYETEEDFASDWKKLCSTDKGDSLTH